MSAGSLSGRVALVTGGGTGIGAGISRALLAADATVVISQRSDERARELARRVGARVGYGADLTALEACDELLQRLLEDFGRIDILVNNAGITGTEAVGPFLDLGRDQLDSMLRVNLGAPIRCSQIAATSMAAGGGGVIIHIGSVAGSLAQFHAVAYSATKAALIALTQGMAVELADANVRVVNVAPGDIRDASTSVGVDSRQWKRSVPLGRPGSPDEVGALVRFLCTDEAGYITGTTVYIDGGYLAY